MANYSLVVNSKFRPFEYQELVAPVLLATQAHHELEDKYADLATKASIWDGLTAGSEKAHKMYTDYARALEEAADELSRYGLTPTSRQDMLNMRSRYGKEIVPIENAYKTRKEQAEKQADKIAKDPTYRYRQKANELSLDKYIDNPNLDVTTEGISGAFITSQVSQAVKHLKDQLLEQGKGDLSSLGLPFQYERVLRYGPSQEDINKALRGDPDALPILTNAVNNAIAASGVKDWGDQGALDFAKYHAGIGLYDSMGRTELKNYTDDYGKSVALEAIRHRNAMKEKEPTENPLDGETSRGWSFLDFNGDIQGYKDIRNKLFTDNGSLKASYFGKNYKNPIAIYDEVTKAVGDISKGAVSELYTPGITNERAIKANQKRQQILDKYGVTTILSPEEYRRLKDLGYDSSSTWDDFKHGYDDKVNSRVAKYTHKSVNIFADELEQPKKIIANYIKFADEHDKLSSTLYRMNADGSLGSAVKSLSDKDIQIDLDKAELSDIYYGEQVPDMIHITLGGRQLYTDPNALGDGAADVVKESKELLSLPDNTLKQVIARRYGLNPNGFTARNARDMIVDNTTAILRDLVRAYNQGRPKTNSHK